MSLLIKQVDFSVHVKCISMQNGIDFRLYDWIYKNLLKWCICVCMCENIMHYFRIHDLDPDLTLSTQDCSWLYDLNKTDTLNLHYKLYSNCFLKITLPLSGIMMLWRIKKSNTMAALLGLKESWTISSGSWNKCHHVWI